MTNEIMPPHGQKRTDWKLSVIVALISLLALVTASVLFGQLARARPELIFKNIPRPTTMSVVVSDGSRLYSLSSRLDISNINERLREKKRLEEKFFLTAMDGVTSIEPQEISPFATASGCNNQLVLFSEGIYRIYDGSKWKGVLTDAIGSYPKGMATPQGLFVMSVMNNALHLKHITADTITDIPLPEEFKKMQKDPVFQLIELVWYQRQLSLFWYDNDVIEWASWNGVSWTVTAKLPFYGTFQAVADDQRLHIVVQIDEGGKRSFDYYTLENNEWKGPLHLPLEGNFSDWGVLMHRGLPILIVQSPFSQTIYMIEGGRLVNLIHTESALSPKNIAWRIMLLLSMVNLVISPYVFGVSTLMRKIKVRSWPQNGGHYEFASLWRRFGANFIDEVILTCPFALFFLWFLTKGFSPDNPVTAATMLLIVIIFYCMGSLLYHALLEGMYGATLGKRIFDISVVKTNLTACGVSAGFVRNLLRPIDGILYYLVGVVAIAGTLKWQRLGDMAAETVVIISNKTNN